MIILLRAFYKFECIHIFKLIFIIVAIGHNTVPTLIRHKYNKIIFYYVFIWINFLNTDLATNSNRMRTFVRLRSKKSALVDKSQDCKFRFIPVVSRSWRAFLSSGMVRWKRRPKKPPKKRSTRKCSKTIGQLANFMLTRFFFFLYFILFLPP